jgi:hypothetical protein
MEIGALSVIDFPAHPVKRTAEISLKYNIFKESGADDRVVTVKWLSAFRPKGSVEIGALTVNITSFSGLDWLKPSSGADNSTQPAASLSFILRSVVPALWASGPKDDMGIGDSITGRGLNRTII